jgi:uncharacterized phage protein (TIGR02220 family)
VKPEFFKDEDLAELPFWMRILFEGLWCYADREGRLEERPIRLKAEILPYDKIDITKGLSALSEKKKHSPRHEPFIIRYEVEGNKYIQILNFPKHQSPHSTEKPSVIPVFNASLTKALPLDKVETLSPQESESESESSLNLNLMMAVVAYLNDKAGKRFNPKSADTIKHISARIAEGRTLDDFRKVIDIKVAKWKGKTWKDARPGREGETVNGDDLLRPSTLFRAGNFENYVNEAATPAKVKKTLRVLQRDGSYENVEVEE